MLTVLATALAFFLLSVAVVRPLWGVLLLWPVLFWYPHALTADLLPFNIGFDDLYVSVLCLMTILHRRGSGMRFGTFGALGLAFWFVYVFGQFYSMVSLGVGELIVPLIKGMVKNSTFLMIGLIVLNSVDDIKDLVRLVRWYLIGAAGLSIIAILQYFYPQSVAAFYNSSTWAPGETVLRATGTTKGPWELGAVLGIAIVMAFSTLLLSHGALSRPLAMVCGFLSMAAIILSTSRAGWALTLVGVLVILVYGKRPILGAAAIGVFVTVLFAFPVLTEQITKRMDYTIKGGHLDNSSTTRIEGWKRMLDALPPASLLTGRGTLATSASYHMTPHNYYIAVVLQFGAFGVLYFLVLSVSLVRAARQSLRGATDRSLIAVWKGIIAFSLGVLIYSGTSDTLNSVLVGQVLFFFWAMLYVKPHAVPAPETVQTWGTGMHPAWSGRSPYYQAPAQGL